MAFKIANDPFVGRITYLRVYSGSLKVGSSVFNPHKSSKEKIQKILQMHADKRTELTYAQRGDIVAVAGLKETITGETLCDDKARIIYDLMKFPEPVISMAIEPKTVLDEKKMFKTLEVLKIEDPSFSYVEDKETGQVLINGMGELHLEIITDRLLREFKVGVNIGSPQVSYREGIEEAESIEELVEQENNGEIEKIKLNVKLEQAENESGILVDIEQKRLKQEIKKDLEEAVTQFAKGGLKIGYPIINTKLVVSSVEFEEEKYNPVLLRIAISNIFQKLMQGNNALTYEPSMKLKVIVPSDYSGDVIADLNSRQGTIQNIEPKGEKEEITSIVPLINMFGYSTDLRSKTQGRAILVCFLKNIQKCPMKTEISY